MVESQPRPLQNEFGVKFRIRNVKDLAKHLGESPEILQEVAHSMKDHYRVMTREIDKNGRKKIRVFYVADVLLGRIQKKIDKLILKRVPLPSSIHGYRRGHSPYTNARVHAGRPVIGKHDLKDHYPNIPHQRVFALYRRLGMFANVASMLTRITTADRHVPQGFSTSPSLSNLITAKLALRLEGMGLSIKAVPTLYADDISLSGGRGVNRSKNLVARIVRQEGFKLNKAKTEWKHAGEGQLITGYQVDSGRPTIPTAQREVLLDILRQCTGNGPDAVAHEKQITIDKLRNHLRGRVNRFRVTPEQFSELNGLFERIIWPPTA